jgi:PadR family transcriptional regulator PadR
MAGREKAVKVGGEGMQLLQGTLDTIVLRTLAAMGPQHALQIATRLEQVSEKLLNLNQGTLYPALVRLEQYGWIAGEWGRTENNREAKFCAITKAGVKALGEETARWRQMMGLVERLLNEDGELRGCVPAGGCVVSCGHCRLRMRSCCMCSRARSSIRRERRTTPTSGLIRISYGCGTCQRRMRT